MTEANEPIEGEATPGVGELVQFRARVESNVRHLKELLFAPQGYLIVATR